MRFDAEALLERLAAKERIKGHHSPEGGAIRTLSRALNGWLARTLAAQDVLVLCNQAMEGWLKARLGVSQWSALGLPALIKRATEAELLTRVEASYLKRIHEAQARSRKTSRATPAKRVKSALEVCIRVIERHW